MRSVHLERDFSDPHALDGYILTESIRQPLERVISGLRPASGRRAWRVTGDYGTGKSSFGLLLAHLLNGQRGQLPPPLRRAVDFRALGLKVPAMLPLLVTGAPEGLAGAIGRSVAAAFKKLRSHGRPPAALAKAVARLNEVPTSDADVVQVLEDLCAYVVDEGIASGVLLVLDELGKFLEFAALHPDGADVYLLQRLAEMADRSGDRPLLLVALLHQGFHAYAEQLPTAAQQEWEKVAGRFEEVLFDQPLAHTSRLVAGTLNVDESRLPRATSRAAKIAMHRALALGWYGAVADEQELGARAAVMYPLHPTVLPVLVRFLRRFGQHERSLFSFLLSEEPFALQDFAARPLPAGEWYRLFHLYDYVRATYGHGLGGQSYRSQWLRISALIEGGRGQSELRFRVLKVVGLLNLLDADDLVATSEAVAEAVGDPEAERVSDCIADLRRRGLLFDRGAVGGLCLWPHTSVSLERAFADAGRAVGPADRASELLAPHLDTRPLVARRHYVETGTLRHFDVRFVAVSALAPDVEVAPTADGLVLVPLCDSTGDHEAAVAFAQSPALRARPTVLVAVPKPLSHLAGAVQDARRWQWVIEHTPELNHDPYAAEEAARQLEGARRALRTRLDSFMGLHSLSATSTLRWFHRGEEVVIQNGRQLLEYISTTCSAVYASAPTFANELVNRRNLSSAAAKARLLLIQRMLESAHLPALGIDAGRAPPEKSIYLSLLKRGGLHRQAGGSYAIAEPEPADDICHVRPALARLHEALIEAKDARVRVDRLLGALLAPPFGVREGVAPILLAIYLKIHEHELAFYEKDAFLVRVGGSEFHRMMKAPATFEAQLCQVVGLRAEVFDRMAALLDVAVPNEHKPQLLDVVTPLCEFAAQLPEYVRKTSSLSAPTRAVRGVLLDAREPAPLLFRDLPRACGADPFVPDEPIDDRRVRDFVGALRAALSELRTAYSDLQQRNEAILAAAFDVLSTLATARQHLAARALRILPSVREPRLKAFCLRLADAHHAHERWVEAVASFVVTKPPARWTDGDVQTYAEEVARLADTFRRVEGMVFGTDGSESSAMRLIVTRADGVEVTRVVHVAPDDEHAIADAENRLLGAMDLSSHIDLAAASRVFLRVLAQGAS